MIRGLLLGNVLGWASLTGLLAESEPALPSWEKVDPATPATPGSHFSNLLPENAGPDAVNGFFLGSPSLLKSPPLLLDEPGLDAQDLSLFLHGGLLAVPARKPVPDPTPSLALREVPAAVLEGLAQVPVNEYLLNPQSVLTEVPAMDVERLLQFHASESRIRLYLLVIDRDQKIGSSTALDPLIRRLGTERDLCLAIYPIGEPWRARFLVSPRISQSSSLLALTEMAEDCIKDALQASEAEQQLQRFAVRLSTRVFWLERVLPTAATPAASLHPHLKEVAPATEPLALPQPVEKPVSVLPTITWSVACTLALAALYGMLRFWLRRRAARRVRHVWLLPEHEVQPRLGGAFSGGAGAAVHYGPKPPSTAR